MSHDNKQIKRLKNILTKIKLEFSGYEAQDDVLFQQGLDALALIGKRKIYELKEDVCQLISFGNQ